MSSCKTLEEGCAGALFNSMAARGQAKRGRRRADDVGAARGGILEAVGEGVRGGGVRPEADADTQLTCTAIFPSAPR